MAIEDRITRVLEQAEADGELGSDLRQRIQVAVKQAFAIERTRLRSEKVVAMSEEDAVRYRIISELATDWVYAARREDEHGRVKIEWATEAFERISGYSVAQLNEKGGLRSIIAPDDREEFDTAEAAHGDGPSVLEYRILSKGGSEVWLKDYRRPELDVNGTRVVRVFGAVKDVTEQKHAEEALHDAMIELEQRVGMEVARFRAVLDQAGETILMMDPRTHALIDVNNTACRALGYSREELLKRSIEDIQVGQVPWQERALSELSESSLSTEQLYRRKDNTTFPVEVTVSLRRFIGQDYLVLVAREITERKQLEAQLAQSDRLASVGVLAAGVAHEINNPLVYIMNNLSYVLTHLPDGFEELASALREARSGAERVRDIVKDLKTFSRSDSEKMEPVDVRTILDSAIKVAHNEIRHRAQLVRQYDDIPPVDANARLGQVFLNLILNAAHAIGEGDVGNNQIAVSVERRDSTGQVLVSIRDTGVGIPTDRLAKIFDPFFTTKPVGVGTGLGLSICRNITEALGGHIDVTSEVGVGSTFTVTLPYSNDRPLGQLQPSSRPPAPSTRSLRVLVVDDDVFVARSIRRLLRPQHDVTLALSGRQALGLIRNSDYDVIFCDVMMPEMTGMELHAAVSKQNVKLSERFVFITGGPFTPEARQLFDAVTNPCIQKPFTPGDLANVLETAILGIHNNARAHDRPA
jgi:two-component system, cell cycle sensor histidine kinase and response regulator CckA